MQGGNWKIGENLKCSDNYTGNGCYDSKALKFRDFVFQKIMASIMVTIDKAEAIGVIKIASPIANP